MSTVKYKQVEREVYKIPRTPARISMITAWLVLFLVAVLHLLKPDQDPTWHMASEYAIGDFGWVMQIAFFCWAASCFTMAGTAQTQVSTKGGKIGIGILYLVGIAIIVAGINVIDPPNVPKEQTTVHGQLHGMSSMIGVPGQCIAILLISKSLVKKYPWRAAKNLIIRLAHLNWITLLLMFGSVILTMTTNDGKFGPGSVIGVMNRIWIIACSAWLITVANLAYRFGAIKTFREPECDILEETLL